MYGVCKICGCTDDNACVTHGQACSWVDEGHELCSSCLVFKENKVVD